jgi:PAS domain S-box-containing protein
MQSKNLSILQEESMGLSATKVSNRRRKPIRDTHTQKRVTPTLSKEYQAVFENTGKAMVIVEEDAIISLANAEFEKLSGYTKEEIEGKKYWTEFVVRDDRKRVKEYHLLRRTDPILAPRCFEFRFLDRQEKVKNIILTIGQIPRTTKSMASLLDVTDRRQAEETEQRNKKALADRVEYQTAELVRTNEALQAEIADLKREVEKLRESEERNRTLIDNIDLAINLIDADYNIVLVNAATTKHTNKPVRKLIGKKCFQEFEKRDAVCPHCPGVQTMATGKLAEVETQGVRDDGSRYHVRIQTFPVFGHDGTVTGFIEIGEDITERKRTEKLLQNEREIFFTILENALYGVCLTDSDGSYLYVNPEFTKITGYTLEDIPTGRDWMNKAYPDKEYRKKAVETWRKDMGRGGITRAFSVVCKNGETREIEFRPTQLDDGRNVVMLADITERKHAEELLQEEREIFFSILHKAPYGVILIDNDGKCLYLNPEFMNTTGYTAANIPTVKDWMHKAYPNKEYRQKVVETWKHEIIQREAHKVFRVRCKDGKIKDFEFRATRLGDGRVIVMSSDVTERRQAEEALRESEERYRTLVENIKLGINLIDSDYNIIMINDALSRRLKKQAGEMIGKKCYREFLKRDAVCSHCPGAQAMATGQPAEGEIEVTGDDQRCFHMRLQAFPAFGQDSTATGFIEVLEDISERKQMEEQLRQSVERFRTLVETMRVGLSAVDTKGVITYVNDQMCQMLGYTREEFIGHPTTDFHDEESRKLQEEMFAKRRKGLKDPTPYEITWVAKDGRKVNTILTPTPGFSPGGEFTGSFALFTDITERKRMEEALRESEERFKRLADNTPFGITIMAPNRTFEYLNPIFTKMFGYTKDEVPDKNTWFVKAYPDEEYRKKVSSIWKQDITEDVRLGEENPRVFTVRCKNGQDKIIDFRNVDTEDGKQYLVYDDITDRINAEEALRESEERFRTLVETTKVGVSAIDEKGVITYANERFGEIWEYSVDEIIGRHVFDFLDEENLKILKEQLSKRKKGSSESYEITWTKKDGSKAPTILSPTPIFDKDGRYRGSYGFITDITERKQMEERLQRYAAELEQSNEEVKNFAYIVSHDLRVPLVNLKGYSAELHSALEVIGSNFDAALPHLNDEKRSAVAIALHEDAPEALEFITNSVSRMDSFINSVLILSRLGRRELKPEPIDMNALVQTSLENLSHQIHERGTRVTVESLPQVVADRTAMEQIIGNILGNAVKYLDPERPGRIEVTAETNNGEQIFRIRDNGRGIAEEDMHKVFAPFRRAGKQDTPGEGMGLAYVQTLVRRQDGRIWCESALGKGSTFTFTITQHRAEGEDHVAH